MTTLTPSSESNKPAPPTDKQHRLLIKMTLSSAFTHEEVARTHGWLASDKATKAGAAILIERAFTRLADKRAAEKASKARKMAYRDEA